MKRYLSFCIRLLNHHVLERKDFLESKKKSSKNKESTLLCFTRDLVGKRDSVESTTMDSINLRDSCQPSPSLIVKLNFESSSILYFTFKNWSFLNLLESWENSLIFFSTKAIEVRQISDLTSYVTSIIVNSWSLNYRQNVFPHSLQESYCVNTLSQANCARAKGLSPLWSFLLRLSLVDRAESLFLDENRTPRVSFQFTSYGSDHTQIHTRAQLGLFNAFEFSSPVKAAARRETIGRNAFHRFQLLEYPLLLRAGEFAQSAG